MSEQADRAGGDGWKIVPSEPTVDMVSAAYGDQPQAINVGFAQAYRAMLRAAPPSGNAGEGVGDIDALAEIWRICDRAGEYSKQNLVGAIARIVEARTKGRATAPPQPAPDAMRARAECDWPSDQNFTFRDDPGEHDPCYVVMPGGATLVVNHHAGEGVDIARAKFIVDACNAALSSAPVPSGEGTDVRVGQTRESQP
jgi:hypothetical protein